MSIIIEIEDDDVFRLYNHYHKACFPHWKEGDIHEVNGIKERRKCRECQEWIEAEQEMQALDAKIWNKYLEGELDPRKREF